MYWSGDSVWWWSLRPVGEGCLDRSITRGAFSRLSLDEWSPRWRGGVRVRGLRGLYVLVDGDVCCSVGGALLVLLAQLVGLECSAC